MAPNEFTDKSLVERRHEFMVNFTDETPNLRAAHFIKPNLSPFSQLPNLPKVESLSLITKPKVQFGGNLSPIQSWQTWVDKLQPTHEQTWRKAGIFDAIKASAYDFDKHTDLLFSLAEKWCPETNTFVFSWGEATITIEDVIVLGGFSPLGDSVLSTSSLGQSVQLLEDKLVNWRSELGVNRIPQLTQTQWAEYFMGRGDELEHAAFIALWLSRHVLITKCRSYIRPTVFSLAARLSSGFKIALAPAILAIIYNGLRLLKEKLVHCSDCRFDVDRLILVAPFHLIQLWAWERFPRLAPIPRMLNHSEPRLARWKDVQISYNESIRFEIELDSTIETFRWRPYATFVENWSFPSFYDDVGKWVCIDSDNEAWEMFACCLRVCSLEGLEDVEVYNPHRVARQFGFDQDIPCSILRSNEIHGLNRQLITMAKLYVPSRLFQGDVTLRYSNWWKGKKFFRGVDSLKVYTRRKLTSSVPVGCNMLKNGNLDEQVIEQESEETLQVCGHRNNANFADLSIVPSQSLIDKAPVEGNMLENGNLEENVMEQRSEETSRLCGHRNDTYCGDLSTAPSLSLIVKAPVECNMLSSENLDEKVVKQKSEETFQLCGHRNGSNCGDLWIVPSPGLVGQAPIEFKSSTVILGENLKMINTEMVHDLVSISDDEDDEEDQNVALFEALVLNIEERISVLEREIVAAMESRQ